MKYYFKFGYKLIVQLAVAVAWMLMIYFRSNDSAIVTWLIVAGFGFNIVMFLYNGLKPVLLAIDHKPLLEFNEIYIHDHMEGLKYYWADIDEISEESGILRLKMYLNNASITNSADALIKSKSNYIKLDNVKGDIAYMLMALNEYSIKAAVLANASE